MTDGGGTSEARPVTALKGVGQALADKLGRLGVETVQDLLFLLPLRYEDRTRTVPIGSLRPGDRAVVEGEVELAEVVFRRKRTLLVRLSDGTGFLTLRFFYFSGAQQQQLQRGLRLRCFGEVRRGPVGLEIVHPEYRRADVPDAQAVEDVLTPIYPATEGVQQGRLRILTAMALEQAARSTVRDWLPPELLADLGLPPLQAALEYVHRPPPDARLDLLAAGRHPAQRRLAFEELLAHQLSLRQLRKEVRRDPAWPFGGPGELERKLLDSLPFALTGAQRRVVAEVRADLCQSSPMLRLVQGDVGSGKTVVAALAALRAVESGCQAALMAPTELLAEQHAQNFERWLRPLGLPVAFLSGRLTGRARQAALDAIASGEVPLVVGTHALFQEGVRFARLGLAIVDEQHRFGVHQRLALREKGAGGGRFPHQLIMTATPIPRTLAMTAYADLDVSVIDELPPGRTPVSTVAVAESRRDEVVARIHAAVREGRQAYWVCPLIEESEVLEAQAAEETAATLAAALPEIRVALVHGRMSSADKERTMARFKAGEIGLLVATTVIEVGVDVPNASLMVIENAERMGLAQLHQLRGRVGRGKHASSCVLLYRPPLSDTARQRLKVLRETTDGFEVARRDLELRGPGELLGTRQTGLMQMKVADLVRDADLLPRVQDAAEMMLARHPANIGPLKRRWIGAGARYGKV
ncbi:MAG: ATP-dependent DNA helicase RecG [Gammaproteobacteria bacterium SG8_30]|nr:MAG: ATP-dependent DNA helicase RecG [Gammaproteobacteria bacterium SG8_30]